MNKKERQDRTIEIGHMWRDGMFALDKLIKEHGETPVFTKFPVWVPFPSIFGFNEKTQKTTVNVDAVLNHLKAIEAAGNWPKGMASPQELVLRLATNLSGWITDLKVKHTDTEKFYFFMDDPAKNKLVKYIVDYRESNRLEPTYWALLQPFEEKPKEE